MGAGRPPLDERNRNVLVQVVGRLDVRPGDQLPVGVDERLDRERPAPGLDRAILAHEPLLPAAVHAHHRPVGLLAREAAREAAARSFPRQRLEERFARRRPLERPERDLANGAGAAGSRRAHPDEARLALRQVERVARAAPAGHGAQHAPRRGVVRALDHVVARMAARRPVDDEAAELASFLKIEDDPRQRIARCALPEGRRVAVGRERGAVTGSGGGGAREHRRGLGRSRGQRRELEVVEPHRARAAAPRRHRELERRDVTDLAAPGGPPGELDLPPLDRDRLPGAWELEVAPVAPPDVRAGGIHELELEVVGPALTAQGEREAIVLGQVEREIAVEDGVAAALDEPEVHPERASVHAQVGRELHLDAVGGARAPAVHGLERVHDPRLARGSRRRRGAREGRGQRPGKQRKDGH